MLAAIEKSFDDEQREALEFNKVLTAEQRLTEKLEAAKRAVDSVNRAINEIEQWHGSK